jgi:hypothetical protein
MPSTYVAKLLVKNCKARSETQELALLCLPQSRGMIAKDILEVMKEAAVNTRLTLLKFLAK